MMGERGGHTGESGFSMPALTTMWACADGVTRTLGEMLEGVRPDLAPRTDDELLLLLSVFGCDLARPVTGLLPRLEHFARRLLGSLVPAHAPAGLAPAMG